MRLVTALLVRNEADRYLSRVLERCAEFSDAILVLDDGSTDETPKVCENTPGIVLKRRQTNDPAWGRETPARAELWDRGAKLAQGGWLLICDADMLLDGDPRPLCQSWDVGAWAFPLVDLWDSEITFRVDGPWAIGPQAPRPWLFNVGSLPKDFVPQWGGRGIHCGHHPMNWPSGTVATPLLFWKHLAYLKPEHRKVKHAQYLAIADQLTPFEKQHAESIVDVSQ